MTMPDDPAVRARMVAKRLRDASRLLREAGQLAEAAQLRHLVKILKPYAVATISLAEMVEAMVDGKMPDLELRRDRE